MSDIAKKKVGRPSKGKAGTFTFRVRADLREKLLAASAASARSASEEIEGRLDASFSNRDIVSEVLGGPEIRHLAVSFAASFAIEAASTARLAGNPDWGPREWLADQACFRAGLAQAVMNLAAAMPDRSLEEKTLLLLDLQNRMGAELIETGALKFKFPDDSAPQGNEFLEPSAEDSAPEALEPQEEWDRRELAHARTLTADKAEDAATQESISTRKTGTKKRA